MIPRITGILCLVGSLTLFWAGCSGDQACVKGAGDVAGSGLAQLGEACTHDAGCQSGFCDRGHCDEPDALYGKRCAPPAPDAPSVAKLPEQLCHGYLCLDGMCRSCQSDAECQSAFGTGKCTVVADAPGWPRREVCDPATTRLPRGAACTEDEQCQTLFCDLGVCVNISPITNYGEACAPGATKAPSEDPRAPAKGTCEGYLCVKGRCRSCQSDAECQAGSSDLKCLAYANWPNKVCVTPGEAASHPYVFVSVAPALDLDHGAPRTSPRVPPAPRSPSRCP